MNATNVRHDGEALLQANWAGGEHELAGRLAEQLVTLAVLHGFPDYVNPLTGDPHDTLGFSWTAAMRLTSSHEMDFHCERA